MDDLERRIRAARPASGHRDLPLTDRAERELAELMLSEPEPASHPAPLRAGRRHGWMLTACAAVLALIVIVSTRLLTPSPAYAATPPLLKVTPIAGTTGDVLRQMVEAARRTNTPAPTGRIEIFIEAWVLSTEDDGIARSSTIVPERYAISIASDGTFTQVVTAGKPVGEITSDTPREGDLLWQETWPADEAPILFDRPAPDEPTAVASFLAQPSGVNPPLSASSSIYEIANLLMEKRLGTAQSIAILEYLATLSDLTVNGKTVDSRGREGILFSAVEPEHPEYSQRVVISPTDGRILATQRVYHGDSRIDIPSPSAINYYVWK